MALENELGTYRKHFEELLQENEGQFALIHEDRIAGCWDSYENALKAGYELFQLRHFMVRKSKRKRK